MNRFHLLTVIIAAILLVSCGGGNSSSDSNTQTTNSTANNAGFNYRAVTDKDLAAVKDVWNSRDLSAKDVVVAYEEVTSDANVKIYEHRIGSKKHYGAIITPLTATAEKLPVEISLDGLDQSNPSISLDNSLKYFDHTSVAVVPTFRGRTMIYKGMRFVADGDFCDAWDGAADDSISFLNVVAATTPIADMSRVLATGYSRGGNLALLLGERDARINTVIDGAGPVDFYRNDVRTHYGYQYQCQFLTNYTEEQSRQRMLASSPLYFNMLPTVKNIYIFNGGNDDIVPLWNPQLMRDHLTDQGLQPNYYIYNGYGHGDIWTSQNFVNAWTKARDDFQKKIQ